MAPSREISDSPRPRRILVIERSKPIGSLLFHPKESYSVGHFPSQKPVPPRTCLLRDNLNQQSSELLVMNPCIAVQPLVKGERLLLLESPFVCEYSRLGSPLGRFYIHIFMHHEQSSPRRSQGHLGLRLGRKNLRRGIVAVRRRFTPTVAKCTASPRARAGTFSVENRILEKRERSTKYNSPVWVTFGYRPSICHGQSRPTRFKKKNAESATGIFKDLILLKAERASLHVLTDLLDRGLGVLLEGLITVRPPFV